MERLTAQNMPIEEHPAAQYAIVRDELYKAG